MKKIVYLITLLFCFPIFVSASSCSGDDRERLQKFANNITFSLEEINDNGGDNTLRLTFSGVGDNLIIGDNYGHLYINYIESYIGEFWIDNLRLGVTYKFSVFGRKACREVKLRTITINVPKLNPYYNDKLCENVREFNLCQKYIDIDITYEEFTNRINEYINGKENISSTNNSPIKKNVFFEFYKKYYWVCMSGLVVFLGLLIFLWIKENKKNKL